MRLSTRLTILLITITSLVALAVGTFAVESSTHSQYAALDSSINGVADAASHPLSALSDALNLVQSNNLNLTLIVIDPRGHVTTVATGDVALTGHPTRADARVALRGIVTAANLPGFRLRAVPAGGGSYLLIAGSAAEVARRGHQLVLQTVAVGLLAALAMGVVARLFMRRDLRTIERLVTFATSVAHGDVGEEVPAASGSADVRELQRALADMVVALRRTIDVEKSSAELMQRFIGDASHELRTPLTVISGYVELLQRPDLSDEQRGRAVTRLAREAGRMDSLVNDLLFLAEVRELRDRGDELVEISDVVAASAHDFALDHPERTVTRAITPGLAIIGRADYVERLLGNALGNVLRHTGATDAVRVTLARDGNDVVLRVDDAGPGLPADSYGAVPESFQRFDPSRSRDSGGSGLGMSIMADVAVALRGTMSTARSDLGGLAVIVRLPVAPDAAP